MTNGKTPPPPKRAIGRSLEDFEELYPAEEKLRKAVAKGKSFRIGEKWPEPVTKDNFVRAGFLRFLALGGDARTPVHEKGVELRGAFVRGGLDLQGCEVICPLSLEYCWFDTKLNLREARLRRLSLIGSRFPGLDGVDASFAGSLYLNNILADGQVWLSGADIRGQFACDGGSFKNRTEDGQGVALNCAGVNITGSVLLREKFTAEGQVSFQSAVIGGQFECDRSSFKNYTKDGQGQALNCENANITGSVLLRNGFAAEGRVNFQNAEISGSIECSSGSFKNRTIDGRGRAINCQSAEIKGDIFLSRGFIAEGKAWLVGSKIGGTLECFNGIFDNSVANPNEAAPTKGGIDHSAADALNLQSAVVKEALWLGPPDDRPGNPVVINGSLDLGDCHVGQLVDHPDSWPPAEIEGPGGEKLRGTILLDGFTYDRIAGGAPCDAKNRKAWLLRQPLEHLGKEFRPQPCEQLIKVLRAMGHEKDAREIAIFKQEQILPGRIAATSWLSKPFQWLWWQFLRVFVGFGYRLWPLFVFVLALWLVSVGIYTEAARQGVFAPSGSPVFQENLAKCRPTKDLKFDCFQIPANEFNYFNPWIYSADVMLPIIKLNQNDQWAPLRREWKWGPLTFGAGFVRGWVWFEIIVGWFGSLLLASVLTGIVKKD